MRTVIVSLIITIFTVYPTRAESSTDRCGANKTVQYPFGFSDSCPIKLNCHNNHEIRIGEFQVQNVTSDSIFVDIPSKCNRTIESFSSLFGKNFAPTRRNRLFLGDCTTHKNNCSFVLRDQFHFSSCGSESHNISCFAEEGGKGRESMDFLSNLNASAVQCKFLVSSIVLDSYPNESAASLTLTLQRVELGWWIDGLCNCSDHSDCVVVNKTDRSQGFRCQCRDGFHGDGYPGGEGCRKGEQTSRLILFII
jgi:hypothetical protein